MCRIGLCEMGCERTCVVCRKVDNKNSLLRFVSRVSGEQATLLFDGGNRLEGRGAYSHLSCIHSNLVRELSRSLRIVRRVPGRKLQLLDEGIEAILHKGLVDVRCVELRTRISKVIKTKVRDLKSSKAQRGGKRGIRL